MSNAWAEERLYYIENRSKWVVAVLYYRAETCFGHVLGQFAQAP